jgi:hypothetical protein
MDTIGLAATAAAVVSAFFVWRQVQIMKQQTALQRDIAESAQQPYVWADVQVRRDAWMLELVVGNSGPTVATNVRVDIQPPFADSPDFHLAQIQGRLRKGLTSLGPGRQWRWTIGPSPDHVGTDIARVVTIDCDGPFGPVATNQYVVNLHNFQEASAGKDPGSIRELTQAVERVGKYLPDRREALRVRIQEEDDEWKLPPH